jgi:hemoglobin
MEAHAQAAAPAATPPAPMAATPFELIGGEPVVRGIAARFYEVMASDPAMAPLRALHGHDLAPMEARLSDFLVQWLGGPPLYFQRGDARCMGQAHAALAIDESIRSQWLGCMARALDAAQVPAALRPLLDHAFAGMTEGMRNH